MTTLSKNLLVRPPTMQDAEAIAHLPALCENTVEYIGYTTKDLHTSWQVPEFNLATDAWVVVTQDEQIVGYAFVRDHQSPISIICENPMYSRQGIWPLLFQKVEERAYQFLLADQLRRGITLSTAFNDTHTIARQTVEQEGYKLVHTAWRMEIVLEHEPEQPQLPEGITFRTFIPGQDEHTVYELSQDAFQITEPFERWEQKFADENFDPTLWFLAITENNVIGVTLGNIYQDAGWIWDVAVNSTWRSKGVGMALLQHAFSEFYRRGIQSIGLDVNAENPTGATRLYHRAGMHTARQYYTYHKDLVIDKERKA